MKILLASSTGSLHDFAQVIIRRIQKIFWISLKSCLRGFCVILCRSLSEELVEILLRSSLRGPCAKILQMPCVRGASMKALLGCSWEVLAPSSCKIFSSTCSSRSFYDDLVGSRRGQGLFQFLVESFCGAPGEILKRSLHDLVQILVRRSCGDLVEILLERSSQ